MINRKNTVVISIVFIVTVMAGGIFFYTLDRMRISSLRNAVTEIGNVQAHALSRQLDRSLSATYALGTFIHQYGKIKDFSQLAEDMIMRYGGISSLQLAPNGVVSHIHPLKGNEKAIGHDLLNDPKRRTEALATIDSRSLTLAGPFELIQGGRAVVGRYPVFLHREGNVDENEFWGFTVVLIKLPELFKASNINSLVTNGYNYALARINPDTKERWVFANSSDSTLKEPVNIAITVPNAEWILSIAPVDGWYSYLSRLLEAFITLIVAFTLSFLFKSRLNHEAAVAITNESLSNEIKERKKAEHDLKESEERLSLICDATFEGIVITEHGTVIDANPQFASMFGYSLSDIIGKEVSELIAPEDLELVLGKIKNGFEEAYEHAAITKDGSRIHVEVRGKHMEYKGKYVRETAIRNITARKHAEQSFYESESKYQFLFSNMLDGFAHCKIIQNEAGIPVDFIYLDVNNAFESMTEIKREDIIGKKASEGFPGIKDSYPEMFEAYGRVAMGGENEKFDMHFASINKWLSVSVHSPLKGFFAALFTDITERVKMESALLEVEEKERERIGYELHDGLGQMLTAIAFKTQSLEELLEKKGIAEAQEVAIITSYIDQAKDRVRLLAKGASVVEMDEACLMNVLEELAKNARKMFDISCTFKYDAPVLIHNSKACRHLYRIAQEAVTNAVKHSSAEQITVSLDKQGEKVLLTIEDNGSGFVKAESLGLGMKIMKFRASAIGASLDITPVKNRGTTICCIYSDNENIDSQDNSSSLLEF